MSREYSHFVERKTGSFYDELIYADQMGRLSMIGECLVAPETLADVAPEVIRSQSLDTLQSLPGCYSVVMETDDTCVVNTDPSGRFPIFWRPDGHKNIVTSTNPADLGSEPDLLFMAANIANCIEVTRDRSGILGVNHLTGGQTAYFRRNELTRLDEANTASDQSLTLEEAAYNVRLAIIAAIEGRLALDACVTSDCSGGFDSTTAALLLAEQLEEGLDVFIHTMPQVGKGDLRYAQAICAENPRLRLHELETPRSALPFQGLNAAEPYSQPDAFVTVAEFAKHWLSAVRGYASELHVLGVGADALFDPPMAAVADLVNLRNDTQLMEACKIYARTYNTDPARLYKQAYATKGRTLNDDLLDVARLLKSPDSFRHHPSFSWIRQPNGGVSFLTEAMRRQLSEASEQQAAERYVPEEMSIGDYVSLRGLQIGGAAQCSLKYYARKAFGIDLHMPYNDRQVVAASMQLPAHKRMHPEIFKPLLQAALPKVIPPILANRTTKGEFSSAMYHGLRAALPTIRGLFTEGCLLEELGVIDAQVVLAEIDKLDMGLDGALPSVDEAIGAEIWLRRPAA